MTQQQRDKVQAILAKGLPIRTAQTISTPRLTNSTVPTTTTSTVRVVPWPEQFWPHPLAAGAK